jgi:hypothetical protein
MVSKRTARNTRHAIALASAKYADPSTMCNSLGMLGERMRVTWMIATHIVTLIMRVRPCQVRIFTEEIPTDNKLVRSATRPWTIGVGPCP